MRIGELARAAGVHVQTIRFYERRGLLPNPCRTSAGCRDYPAHIVHLVQFIRQVQAHGYALEEIRERLVLTERGTDVAEAVRDRAKKKVQQIEAEIARLCGIRDWLMQFVSQSERGVAPPECLVLRRAAARPERVSCTGPSRISCRQAALCYASRKSSRSSRLPPSALWNAHAVRPAISTR